MKTIHIFGDSFAFGEIEIHTLLLNDSHFLRKIKPNTLKMAGGLPPVNISLSQHDFLKPEDYLEYVDYCNSHSFIGLLCQQHNINAKNHAVPGASNTNQIMKFYSLLANKQIRPDDIIFFCLTSVVRDIYYTYERFGKQFDSLYRYFFDHDQVELDKKKDVQYAQLLTYSYFSTLSVIHSISKQWPCIAINGFINPFTIAASLNADPLFEEVQNLYNSLDTNFLIGSSFLSNTLVDILIDNFGNNEYNKTLESYYMAKNNIESNISLSVNGCMSHAAIDLQSLCTYIEKAAATEEYKKYFQLRYHPTIIGNEKIATILGPYIENNYKNYF